MSAKKSKSANHPKPEKDSGEGKGPPDDRARPDAVGFDNRGNAIWEWSIASGTFVADPSTDRLKRLENPNLSIAPDAPTPYDIARPNPLGTVKGYNPYDSGKLDKSKKTPPKKKDLRKLSEWMKLKKQHLNNRDDDE